VHKVMNMSPAEVETWARSAPAHQVHAAHTEAELAIGEWRQRLNRPEELRDLASPICRPMSLPALALAAGRAALELEIIRQTWPASLDALRPALRWER
jgi:hypothetical protein